MVFLPSAIAAQILKLANQRLPFNNLTLVVTGGSALNSPRLPDVTTDLSCTQSINLMLTGDVSLQVNTHSYQVLMVGALLINQPAMLKTNTIKQSLPVGRPNMAFTDTAQN